MVAREIPDRLHVHFLPEVKERINADVEERERSMNDVVVGILSAHYGLRFEGTNRRSGAKKLAVGNGSLLRTGRPLWRKIDQQKSRTRVPKEEIVNRILCDHYGLDYDNFAGTAATA